MKIAPLVWMALSMFVESVSAQGVQLPFVDAGVSAGATSAAPVRAFALVYSCFDATTAPDGVQVQGNVVTWTVDVTNLICGVPPPPYPIETTFGPLAPGQYTLLLRARFQPSGQLGPSFPLGFTVASGSIPALDSVGVLVLAGLLGFFAIRRVRRARFMHGALLDRNHLP